MLVGGGPNFVLATPRNIPPGVGYGWQFFPRDKFWVRVSGRTTRHPVTHHNKFLSRHKLHGLRQFLQEVCLEWVNNGPKAAND